MPLLSFIAEVGHYGCGILHTESDTTDGFITFALSFFPIILTGMACVVKGGKRDKYICMYVHILGNEYEVKTKVINQNKIYFLKLSQTEKDGCFNFDGIVPALSIAFNVSFVTS